MWGEITYPFPNFNGCTIELWEWISNCIPHFIGHVISYPCQQGLKSYWERRRDDSLMLARSKFYGQYFVKNKIVIKFLGYAQGMERISRTKPFQGHSWKVKVTRPPTNVNTKMAVTVNFWSIEMKQKLHIGYTSGYIAMLFKFQFHFWFYRSPKNVLNVSRHGRRDWNPRVFM